MFSVDYLPFYFILVIGLLFSIGFVHRNLNTYRFPDELDKLIPHVSQDNVFSDKHRSVFFQINPFLRIKLTNSHNIIFVSIEKLIQGNWETKESDFSLKGNRPLTLSGPWKKQAYQVLKAKHTETKYL